MLLLLSVRMSACLSRLYTEHTVYAVLAICWLETSEWKYWYCGYIGGKGLAKGVHWQLRSCLWLAAWERGSTLRKFCTAWRWVRKLITSPLPFQFWQEPSWARRGGFGLLYKECIVMIAPSCELLTSRSSLTIVSSEIRFLVSSEYILDWRLLGHHACLSWCHVLSPGDNSALF